MAQRAAIINDIRKKNQHVLLLDAGDIISRNTILQLL